MQYGLHEESQKGMCALKVVMKWAINFFYDITKPTKVEMSIVLHWDVTFILRLIKMRWAPILLHCFIFIVLLLQSAILELQDCVIRQFRL